MILCALSLLSLLFFPLQLTLISSWGPLRLGNSGHYFRGATKLRINATDAPDLSGTTNMQFAFYLTSLVDEDFNHWNMSGVRLCTRVGVVHCAVD